MSSIHELSAVAILNKIKANKLTVSDVTNAFIQRIEQINPSINAIVQYHPQALLQQALQADVLHKNGGKLPPLYGLPISIKDTFHVKGFKSSKGCISLFNKISPYDATVVARLRAAGAMIFGLTNVPELLLSYETDNLLYGRSNNPYDLQRTPGGSSGGQAALIAAGGISAGIGNDAGGSIRQPAHYCGICAHKPTHGLVPQTGTFPTNGLGLGAQLLAVGPMARHVEDLILLMNIIVGPDDKDPHCVPVSFQRVQTVNPRSLRIGYFFENPTGNEPTTDTINAITKVIQLLQSEGFNVRENYPSILNNVYRLHLETFIFGGNGGESVKRLFNKLGQEEISPLAQNFLKTASQTHFSITELRERLVEIEQFRYSMMEFMENYDIILSPVTATPAHLHGETWKSLRDVGYIIAHNLTGWPATVIPCGYAKNGLPIGLQIAAKPWHDHLSLALALKIQQMIGVFPIPT